MRSRSVLFVANSSGCASVVPRKFPIAPFHGVVPEFPVISHANVFKLGRSATTRDRKVGIAFAPDVGPAKTVFAGWVTNDPVNVPEVVTGEPLIENTETGRASPTLVTEPSPTEAQLIAPPAVELSTCPLDEGAVIGNV